MRTDMESVETAPVESGARVSDKSLPRPPKHDYLLSVVIPVYNERDTIHEILGAVRDVEIPKEIILVDDGSKDGTRDILRNEVEGHYPDVKVYFHEKNQGKGAALRTAISKATGNYVVIQDADLEYDPREYYALLAPILDGRADVVYGSRFIGSGPHRVCFFWHRIANSLLTNLSNVTTNLNLTDMEVCYKVFKREIIQSLPLRCNRFDFEPEVTAKVSRWRDPEDGHRCRIYEVAVSYSGRDYSEGKKIGLKDAFQAVWAILRYGWRD
jgi:glycosyltransferase involved in cell wall biosynthesis